MVNYVKEIYAPFTDEEISVKMVELLTPAGTQAKVEIVYQTLEACMPLVRSIRVTGISPAITRHRAELG